MNGQQRQMWSSGMSSASPASAFFSSSPSLAGVGGAAAFVPKDAPGSASGMAARVAARQRQPQAASAKANPTWVCTTCTFGNKATRDQCEMCEAPNPRAQDPPASAVVAAASSKPVSGPAPVANGVKPKLPTPSPAPAPITLVSPVSASFKAQSYENGLITACNNLTYDEVMRRQLVGLPRAQFDLVSKMKHKSSAIFLLNLESKELFGVFEAEGAPGLDIEPDAWSGQAASAYRASRSSRFPAQCRFTIAADFETPIQERHYREIFARNPQQKIRTLSADEVKKLIKVFQQKSKLRKIATQQPPVQTVVAPAPVAAPAAAPSASSSAAAAPVATSASTSRRNSLDSTASEEDRLKKKSRVVTKIQQTCKRWLADECVHTDETCKYLHVPSICRAFQRGTCPKGAQCPFVHDKVDREHYRHGRSYCQKTAVHADLAPPAKTAPATAASASASRSAPPKDSLDSILSGLGSWKSAPPKRQESEPQLRSEAAAPEAHEEGDAASAHAAAAAAAAAAQAESDAAALLEAAAEFEQDQASSAAFTGEHDDQQQQRLLHQPQDGDDEVTFDAAQGSGGFLDAGLSFDLPTSLSAGAVGSVTGVSAAAVAAGPWGSAYDEASFVPDEDGGMYFAPPGGAFGAATGGGAGGQPQQPQQQPAMQQEEEFPWFMQFRTAVVQPALQAMHNREQRGQQKIIGPD